jgi:hypothetical protein
VLYDNYYKLKNISEMDKASTIIMLGIIVATILPFFIFYIIKKGKDGKFLKHFIDLAQKEKISISQREFWDHKFVIGIDTDSKKIIYANKLQNEVEEAVIDLTEVEKCRVVTINKANKSQNGKNPTSDRLELVFTYRNAEKPEKSLKFYENDEFMPNAAECSHVENWYNIISAKLKEARI